MVLEKHVPDELSHSTRAIYRDRFPNYCPRCAAEIVVAGGQVEARAGWYDSLDPVLQCSGEGCVQWRMAAGVDQEEGQEFRVAPGAESWDDLFSGFTAFCDIHVEDMVETKDLLLDGRPARQYKCETCDRDAVLIVEEDE